MQSIRVFSATDTDVWMCILWPAIITPVSLLHKAEVLPVLLSVRHVVTMVLQPVVSWSVSCYESLWLRYPT